MNETRQKQTRRNSALPEVSSPQKIIEVILFLKGRSAKNQLRSFVLERPLTRAWHRHTWVCYTTPDQPDQKESVILWV